MKRIASPYRRCRRFTYLTLLASALAGCRFDTAGLPESSDAGLDDNPVVLVDAAPGNGLADASFDARTPPTVDAAAPMAPDAAEPDAHVPPDPPDPTWQNILQDVSFENRSGAWSEWSSGGWSIINSRDGTAHRGEFAAWFGGVSDEIARIRQTVEIPGDASEIHLRGFIAHSTSDVLKNDVMQVVLRDITADTRRVLGTFNGENDTGGIRTWSEFNYRVPVSYAGKSVEIIFSVTTDSGDFSALFGIDDVQFQVLTRATID